MPRQSYTHFVEILCGWAASRPDAVAYRFLSDDGSEQTITFQELDLRARVIAAELQQRGRPGQRAVLLYPPSLEYVAAFLGCLYAGVIAVPAYPPDPARLARTLPRLQAIVADAQAEIVLTTSEIRMMAEFLFEQAPDLKDKTWLATDTLDAALASSWSEPGVTAETVAFLQYTSGSTGIPRGVVLTHGNLVHNQELICEAMEFWRDERVMISWLPPYHDMGLIGGILAPLYNGFSSVLMAPMSFLQKPLRWLEAISRFRGTVAGSPNFGYDLCVRRVSDAERDALDLSTVEVLFSGAEPVRKETLKAFADKFARSGFRSSAFYPCYGLAEATLIVSGGRPAEAPVTLAVDAISLEHGLAVAVPEGDAAIHTLVSCGRKLLDEVLVVVAAGGGGGGNPHHPVLAGHVGEVLVSSGSVASGYFRRPEESAATFEATVGGHPGRTFLRTGDLGFLNEGELYITGRAKDLIIVRGRNIYPQDLERTVEECYPTMRPGCSAAFSLVVGSEERVVVVAEFERRYRPDRRTSPEDAGHPGRRQTGDRRGDDPAVQAFIGPLADKERQERDRQAALPPPVIDPTAALAAARSAVSRQHDVQLHAVVLITAGTIPKTSSGKVQRHAAKAAYLAQELALVAADTRETAEVRRDASWEPESVSMRLHQTASTDRRVLVEHHLRHHLGEALGLDAGQLSRDTPLAELGIDSLLAAQLVWTVREVYGVDIPMRVLFEEVTTLTALTERIERSLRNGLVSGGGTVAPIERAPDALYRPSFGQERLWFLHQLDPEDVSYNIVAAHEMVGPLDDRAFEHALAQLVARHEAFRTSFRRAEEGLLVQLGSETGVPLERVDLRADDRPSPIRIREVVRALGETRFDLTRAPLARARLVRLEEDRHVFVLVVHHIVADGWSGSVVVRELAALYEAAAVGTSATLPGLAVQYVDYAAWQRRAVNDELLATGLAYWQKALLGAPHALELPTDRTRPPMQTFAGELIEHRLPVALTTALKEVSRAERVTPFMTLFAAFAALLSRYAGQGDLLVGTPISNRTQAETENVVGFFVNTVALRAQIGAGMRVRELIQQARDTLLGAYTHKFLPFERLVEALSPVRDLSRGPLVQVLFNLIDARMTDLRLAGLEVTSVPPQTVSSSFDLSVQAIERDGAFVVAWEFNSALFDRSTVERMAAHYAGLLSHLVEGVDRALDELDPITPEERRQLLVDCNQTAADFASWGPTVLDDVARAVAARPEALALVAGGRSWTYEELAARSNQLAHALVAAGLRPEEPVAVCMERSPATVVSALAVLKAGGAYLPVDPQLPHERLAFLLTHSQVRHALVDEPGERRVEAVGGVTLRRVDLDARWSESAADLAQRPHPASIAYLLYTSGSTGVPKGVVNTHAGLANHTAWFATALGFGPQDRSLFKTPFTFDVSMWELFVPLATGGTLVVARPDGHKDPRYIAAVAREERITAIHFVASMLQAFLADPEGQLPHARLVITSGEALSHELEQEFFRRFPELPLHDLYGPTEAAVHATAWTCRPRWPGPRVPIGSPVANTTAYVLDARMEPAPVGIAGELYLGGVQVARGYFGRPDLTAERFVPHPHASRPGERLYRTGDLARRRADGAIDYLGRVDFQVKIRGVRIELGDVEAALLRHASVREAVVTARHGANGDAYLVAYLVGVETDARDLREHLRRLLPDYMVPGAIVWLDSFPQLASGKIKRDALPAPEVVSSHTFVPPRRPLEQELAAIWQSALGVPRVGVHDDFFELGGHSLLATRVLSRIRAELAPDLALRDLFEAPTLAALAVRVEAAQGRVLVEQEGLLPRVTRGEPLPLTHAQLRIWFLDRLEGTSRAYVMPAAIHLDGPLDDAALEASLRAIVARHEALRTAFVERDGEPWQIVSPTVDLTLARSDLERSVDREAALSALEKAATAPFDPTRAPLLRAHLARVGPDRHVLYLAMHHLVSDGWTVGIVLRELAELYAARRAGRLPALAELPIQYGDFALWQRRWLAGGALRPQLAYWQQVLRDPPPPLDLPSALTRPAQPSLAGARRHVRLPDGLVKRLRTTAREANATPFMVALAGYALMLSRSGNRSDLVIGTPIANRTRHEQSDLIGLFANTLALRVRVPPGQGFRQLLAHVRELALAAYTHQDVPFEMLVDELALPRDVGRTPLFQTMFVWETGDGLSASLVDVSARLVELETGAAKFDLTLQLRETADGVSATVEYRSEIFDPASIADFVERFVRVFDAALREPDRAVGRLPWVSEAETRQLLATGHGPRVAASAAWVHELVLDRARRHPERVAVRAGASSLTYAGLAAQASGVAAALIERGAGPETVVGVCHARNVELPAAALGVLLAGAAYLPLEPALPPDRLAGVLGDAGARLVLVDDTGERALASARVPLLRMDACAAPRARAVFPPPHGASLAYVVYTSGSTGRPKGVLVAHASLRDTVATLAEAYGIDEHARVLFYASIAFDAAVEEMFKTLAVGATLHLAEREELLAGPALATYLRRQRITHATLPPVALAATDPADAADLRVVVSAGDVLGKETAALWSRHATLLNAYGPTEGTICTSVDVCLPGAAPTIGRPIAGRRAYVLDAEMGLAPPGVVGELHIGGNGVARGYQGDPALTAATFLPDPWSDEPGARMYRTGDLARVTADGKIDFLGRRDRQVKLRGFRIELGEIEATLRGHPDVADAAVDLASHGGTLRLVAFVAPRPGHQAVGARLREHLARELPEYMVPATVTVVERMPLTTGGKIDRASLRAGPVDDASPAHEAPAGAREEALAEVWATTLHLDRVSVSANFFEVGGDSILAIQVVTRAAARGLRLTPRMLFRFPTVRALAAAGDADIDQGAEQGVLSGEVPLTPAQRWFFDLPLRHRQRWNQALVLEVTRALDAEVLRAAIEVVLDHHDGLRARFTVGPGGPSARIEARENVTRVFEHVPLGADQGMSSALAEVVERLHASMDLEHGPLLRVALVEAPERSAVALVAHHLVVDGVSWRILVDHLERVYLALAAGQAPTERKTTSLRRWAELTGTQGAALAEEELPAWRSLPWDAARARTPLFPPRDGAGNAPSETVRRLAAARLAPILTAAATTYRARPEEVVLAAVVAALRSRQGEVALLEVESHGRDIELGAGDAVDLTRTVGWLTAIHPLVVDLRGAPGPGQTLVAVKEALRRVPRRGAGFALLRTAPVSAGEVASWPRPDVAFNFHGEVTGALAGSNLFRLGQTVAGSARAHDEVGTHAVEINASLEQGELVLGLTTATAGDALTTLADEILQHLAALAAHLTDAPRGQLTPSDFEQAQLTSAELQRLEGAVPGIADVYPLTGSQAGILFHALLHPGEPAYVAQLRCQVSGTVDVTALRRAWQAVVDRHDAFRTSVHWEGLTRPVQVVHGACVTEVDVVDLRAFPAQEREAAATRAAEGRRRDGFDLVRAPLARLSLLTLAPDRHELVFTNHHLILDGWSLPIVFGDLAQAYDAGPAPDVTPPFSSYVTWLRRQPTAPSSAYFREAFAGFVPASLTVDDGERPGAGYGERRLTLGAPDVAALLDLARRLRITPTTVLLGAWAVLLSRYTGQRDVAFGVTFSGRSAPVPGIDRMVGLFINTVPVRVDVDEALRIGDWLARLQLDQDALREHEHAPLHMVNAWLGLEPGAALFDTLFVFENYPLGDGSRRRTRDFELGEVRGIDRTNYGVTISAFLSDTLTLELSFDQTKLGVGTAEHVLDHLAALLRRLAEAETRPLGDMTLLEGTELESVLAASRASAVAGASGELFHSAFERQAARSPDAVAVQDDGHVLTYGDLDARANALAAALQRAGVGTDDVVAVCADRSFEMVVAVVGILKAGAGYAPLQPWHPRDFMARRLRAAGCRVAVAEPAYASLLTSAGAEVVLPLEQGPAVAGRAVCAAHPRSVAVIMFTSGSTGVPKAVALEHAALVNHAAWLARSAELSETDRVLQSTALDFDVSAWEIFGTLGAGARLVLDRGGERRDLEHTLELIATHGVTVLQTVPSLLRAMLDLATLDVSGAAACTTLSRVYCAGEAMPAELPGRFQARWPGAALYNAYGPTEATIDATMARIANAELNGPPPIGRPVDNTAAYVLDRRMRLVPVGVAGELYLGGAGLARGYAGDPAATASAFVCDPFSAVPGGRLYRTGDAVRRRRDGSVAYLGRVDDQIKLRGVRIEPGDIEARLKGEASVRDAVVVVREDRDHDRRLVAYVVPANGAVDPAQLREALARSLPQAMIPAAFVTLERLPLTSSGKVDRRALPAPEALAPAASRSPLADAMEETVAAAFADVLHHGPIGREDSFFALGGDSILSIRLAARLREITGLDVPVRAVFDAPKVADLAARLRGGALLTGPKLAPSPRDAVLPLSPEQERMWLYDQLDAAHRLRNVSGAVRLDGDLRAEWVEQAVLRIVQRHEVLRTSLPCIDGRPRQVIHAQVATPYESADWSAAPDPDAAALEDAWATQAADFDVTQAPLLRVKLQRVRAHQHVLLVTMHHLIADHWSVNVFVDELTRVYRALASGVEVTLPPLAVQFADYVAWKRERAPLDAAYWRQAFASDPPLLQLPTDHPRGAAVSLAAAAEPLALGTELTSHLEAFARGRDATLFMALLAAFELLLHRYTGHEEIVLGGVVVDRNQPELQGLIGYFSSTLAYKTTVSPELGFGELLDRTRESVLAAGAHPEVPYEELLQQRRHARGTGLFQVFVNFVNRAMETRFELAGITASVLPNPPLRFSPFEFELSVQVQGGAVTGAFVYNTSLFEPATVARMRRRFVTVIEGALESPARALSTLPMLDAEERRDILASFESTARSLARRPFVHHAVERFAREQPERVAVRCGGTALTYRDLEHRSAALAARLAAAGVGVEDRVGVSVARSVEMLVAVLAVLRLGAAYVPLDPAYPPERLAYMLADSGARALCVSAPPTFPVGAQVAVLDVTTRDERAAPPRPALHPEHLAYVIYTSGSTGQPKGVAIPHRALFNVVESFRDLLQLAPECVLLSVTSLSFDIAGLELYLPLTCGGTVVVATREEALDGGALAARIRATGTTLMQATPSTWQLLVAAGWSSPQVTALIGGEAVPPQLSRELLARCQAAWNVYGPTETTVWSAARRIIPDDEAIGGAVHNTELLVVDPRLDLAGTGIAGELVIGGLGLARGYFGRPDLTAERFVPSPFGPPGARLYRTGDLVRLREDRAFDFLGRIDLQVKVRGFRIELGEIEAALATVPDVAASVVVVREDAPSDPRIVAYYVARSTSPLDPADLRAVAARLLPEYMVPAHYVQLDAWPLTPNGKVDRRALPEPAEVAGAPRRELVPLEDEMERELARIWSAVLGVDTLGAEDDFFWLGGHSLLATQMLARVAQRFQVELPLTLIFTMKATVRELAREVRKAGIPRHDDAAVEDVLAELDQLTEEEALALLAEADD